MEIVKQTKATRQKSTHQITINTATGRQESYDLIVFCHLRWQFVYQRPQHIISRLAKNMKILLIEEPLPFAPEEKNTAERLEITENLHVLQPRVENIASIKNILPEFVANRHVEMGWFYSASFVPLLDEFRFDTVVYDCMDELSQFRGAPAELIVQEKFLMAQADIVFTGGKSLYEAKKKQHPNVFCFPSSVDREHFAKAMNGVAIPEDIANIPHPIVGYYGVIDERIDLDLIRGTADRNPDVQFVMIGPIAKINDEDLPKAENIHYLGMRPYNMLPNYLKAFSVAMMPFALNEATEFISPTKTLEYMAAGKCIVSTPIRDVVRDYKHCVSIVQTPDEFSEAVQFILENPHDLSLECEYDEILEKTSWNNTVNKMQFLISKTAKV